MADKNTVPLAPIGKTAPALAVQSESEPHNSHTHMSNDAARKSHFNALHAEEKTHREEVRKEAEKLAIDETAEPQVVARRAFRKTELKKEAE